MEALNHEDMGAVDDILLSNPALWDSYTTGVRRIFMALRRQGVVNINAAGLIAFLSSRIGPHVETAGPPEFARVQYIWRCKDGRWALYVDAGGIVFKVPKQSTPEGALQSWESLVQRLTEGTR